MPNTQTTGGGSTSSFSNTPQAKDDVYGWSEDALFLLSIYNATTKTVTLDVMANDSGGGAKSLFSIDDGNGNPIAPDYELLNKDTVGVWETTAQGNQIRIVNGKIEYKFNNDINALGSGQSFQDVFVYAIRLGNGTLSQARVTLTISGSNDGPTANADSATTAEDDAVLINVLANDTDPDSGDTLSVTSANVTSGLGSASVVGNQVRYDPGTAYNYLAAGESATVTISYAISDGHGGSATSTVTVTVTGTNDGPVLAADDTGAVTEIADGGAGENVASLSTDGTIAFTDADLSDTHSVSFTAGGSGYLGAFSASVSEDSTGDGTGSVSWTFSVDDADVDHLGAGEFLIQTYTVTIDDGEGGTSSRTVTITINGSNDAIWAVVDGDGAANAVDENAANGTVVGISALATDDDASDTISYSLDDNAGGRFAIDATTGVVTVANGALLDREAAASHVIVVRASSTDGTSSTQSFTINLNDLDEFNVTTPVDNDGAANAVDENAAIGTVVGVTAFASDADATDNMVTYSLSSNPGGLFAIDANTGVVTVAAAIDRETVGASVTIEVTASSSDGSSAAQTFVIAINDVDEFNVTTPVDNDGAANAVDENAAAGTVVGVTAFASDADATNNSVTYSLSSNPGGLFAIDANTGVVTVAAAIDRETVGASVTIEVTAQSADGSSATQSFEIAINDVDEFNVSTPVDNDGAANAVDENASAGTVVGVTAFASDADATNNIVTYSLSSNPGGLFAIDANTGVVTVAAAIDRETVGASVTIEVTASSSDGSSAAQSFVIAINDVDEFDVSTPTDSDGGANAVDENAAAGTVVGITADAFDVDATNNTITYSLSVNPNGLFAIDANTGVVTVAGAIDRETVGASLAIEVTASSSDGSSAAQTFVIAINDVDEFDVTTPTDTNAAADAVDENAASGTVVGVTAYAFDADATTNAVTYSLSSNPGGLFAIDANTGVVSVAGAIDRETIGASVTIEVKATSADGSIATQSFEIAINDVDEFNVTTPVDNDGAANAVDENASAGTVVGVTAFASDADATNNLVTYSLTSNPGGLFAIDANTGVVTVAGAIDREAVGASVTIEVTASSSDGSSAAQTFVIAINDVDEFNVTTPVDNDAAANAVDENSAAGTLVGVTAYAFDADATNNAVTYSLSSNPGGLFAIDANTGVVTAAGAIDRESVGASVTIEVTASSSDGSSAAQTFVIAINDVDEFNVTTPVDTDAAANAVDENAAAGTVVGITAFASDADATNNTITYSLSSNPGSLFAIDANTGVVTVAGAIDRESVGASVTIEVTASSSDGSSAAQTFVIAINDVDEFNVTTPVDNDAAANAVDENSAAGTVVGVTAFASDADATNNIVTYSLSSNPGGLFAIDANTGVVTVAGAIDRETVGASVAIEVTATSSDGSVAAQTFVIAINDVDEFNVTTPVDNDGTTNAVEENSSVGTVVGITAFASDADATNNAVTYSLSSNPGGLFAIDANTGVVTVAAAIDRETVGASVMIEVTAQSADGSTATQTFTIAINDVDEFDVTTPVDNDAAANAVDENSSIGTVVGVTAFASDADATTNGVTYSLSSNPGGLFAIDANTGVVTVAAAIDRETVGASAIIEVTAQSADGSTATQTFTIAINDVDEFNVTTPVDNDAAANAVDENSSVGTVVGVTAFASDADATNNGVTYSLDDDAGGRFAIDATTGVVTVANGGLLDRETAASYGITVRATSTDGSTATQSFTINLNDVDEFDVSVPVDSDAGANAVDENAANGTVVGITAFASDGDATNNGVSYSLDDNAGGRFAINASTGVVTVANGTLLDREIAASYAITVRATSADGSTATQTFTINLNDVDEFDVSVPVDSDAAVNAVDENAANGTVVGVTAFASDGDATNNGVTYSLDDSAGGRFTINAATGVVTVANGGLLDRESAASYGITVRATSTDGSTATQTFTINLNDVDEFDVSVPVDSDAAVNAVSENAANGTVVGVTAFASDGDATNNGVTYSLDGDAGGRFAINASTGVVTVANGALLDREIAASHAITVRATSADGSFATQTFTINLIDVDEFDVSVPVDSDAGANAVNENAATGTVVGITAFASDGDATNNNVTYSLDDSAGGRFAINASTGVVTVANGALLDREAAASHQITVRATSADGSSATETFTISLNDVDEFDVSTPVDSDAAANAVNENAASGAAVGVTAFASDGDATNNGVTYSLDDSAGGRFAINATTGVVTVANGSLLDREAAASHQITVRATSADGSFATETFTINVGDVDEFDVSTPVDSNAAANAVNENAANGTAVGVTAFASDADATNNAVTYSLDDSAGGRFAINAATGVVTVANGALLDREAAGSHSITVRAASSDGSSATQTFTINVGDVDEFDVTVPVDTNAAANAVNENAANGTTVGITAFASDADATTNAVSYSLDDSAGGRFAINASTGVVTVANGLLLDRETAASYGIIVRATSADGSSATQAFTISLNDVDEFDVSTPVDTDGANGGSVAENAANGTTVGITASASDADFSNNVVSYSLSNNAGGRFAINAATGVVTVANGALLDYEAATSHSITVVATSTDGSSASQNFTVAVTDVAEGPPRFAPTDLKLTAAVPSGDVNFNSFTFNGTLTATDPDAGAFTFSIVTQSDAGVFSIPIGGNTLTGALTANKHYTVTIKVTQAGDPGTPAYELTETVGVRTGTNGNSSDTGNGVTGDDIMYGNGGGDFLYGLGGSDMLFGQTGDDTMLGGDGNDALYGDAGSDVLQGGIGADTLTGGGGIDFFRFAFESSANVADYGVDTIVDFTKSGGNMDKFELDDALFTALGAGPATLAGTAFVSGAGAVATSAAHRIIYDTSTGNLYYDADGSGAGAAIHFATVTGAPSLANTDFLII